MRVDARADLTCCDDSAGSRLSRGEVGGRGRGPDVCLSDELLSCGHMAETSGWVNQGFINVVGALVSIYALGGGIDFVYAGMHRDGFLDSMEAHKVSESLQ